MDLIGDAPLVSGVLSLTIVAREGEWQRPPTPLYAQVCSLCAAVYAVCQPDIYASFKGPQARVYTNCRGTTGMACVTMDLNMKKGNYPLARKRPFTI